MNLQEPGLMLRAHFSWVCFQSTRCQFFSPRPQGCARNFYFLRNPVIQLPFVGPAAENEGCSCSTSSPGRGLPGKGLQATSRLSLCSSLLASALLSSSLFAFHFPFYLSHPVLSDTNEPLAAPWEGSASWKTRPSTDEFQGTQTSSSIN